MSNYINRLALLVLAGFLFGGCDSGNDNSTELIVPSVDDVTVSFLADDAPEIAVASAERATFPASVIPSNLVVSTAGNQSLSTSLGTTPQAPRGTGSLLIDSATGAVSTKVLVVPASGRSYVTDVASSNPASPAISGTDSKGNVITYTFDGDMNFQSASFQPGSSAGAFSAAYASQVNSVMSKQRSVLAEIELAENVTVADVAVALLSADAAGKRFRDVTNPGGTTPGVFRFTSMTDDGPGHIVPVLENFDPSNIGCSFGNSSTCTAPYSGSLGVGGALLFGTVGATVISNATGGSTGN